MTGLNLGIVGHAADKFTPETSTAARQAVLERALDLGATRIVSGGCHLGGVDLWAEDLAALLGLPKTVHLPRYRRWRPDGYEARNLLIARDSDLVLVVVVRDYPPNYPLTSRYGARPDGSPYCYHCGARNPTHVKSGGCWTAWKAKRREWVFV